MLKHHRNASKTPFKWRFAGGLMMAHLYWHLDPPSPHKLKKHTKKNCQSWTPTDKTFLDPRMMLYPLQFVQERGLCLFDGQDHYKRVYTVDKLTSGHSVLTNAKQGS